jgi:hypothetical protein
MKARAAELLPVPYFHVVFTLPSPIGDIAYQNKAVIYDLLFRASAETMLTIAADPKHLGARIGITAVLHSWGSAMTHHPHVHMIVPGGGICAIQAGRDARRHLDRHLMSPGKVIRHCCPDLSRWSRTGRDSACPGQRPASSGSASAPCCPATRAQSILPRGSAITPPATSSAAASSTAVSKSP